MIMRIAIKGTNNRFLCAELGGGIYYDNGVALVVNREFQNIWEEFKEIPLADGKFALQTNSGNYVTAEDNKLDLSTNRTIPGAWEEFSYDGDRIRTHHGYYLAIGLNDELIQDEVGGQWTRIPLEVPLPVPGNARTGIVRADGRCAVDDKGGFHPLGLTFFWGLYGWKFEQERVYQHFEWMKQYGYDYLRILCETNWPTRTINPDWPDYQNVLAGFVDTAYDYGMRVEATLIGGNYAKPLYLAEKVAEVLNNERQHKVILYEVANEWKRLDKISATNMVATGKWLRNNTPNLVALSASTPYLEIIELSKQAGANAYVYHPRRSEHDKYWSSVRQGYDAKEFPAITFDNEPQGPQSSVFELSNPMQLALSRATNVVCSGAGYVLHVGQGVTGIEDPNHGRPENMWEVHNIDSIMKHVRLVDVTLPLGIENWRVVNNGRSAHPLPLDPRIGVGFWESNTAGSVNKNYACVEGSKFVEVLLGVKNTAEVGMTLCGNAKNNSDISAHNIVDYHKSDSHVDAGRPYYLGGRKDTMVGYVLNGNL